MQCVLMYVPKGVDVQEIMRTAGVKPRIQKMPERPHLAPTGKTKKRPHLAPTGETKKRAQLDPKGSIYKNYNIVASHEKRHELVKVAAHKVYFQLGAHEYPSATLPSILTVKYTTKEGIKTMEIPVKDLGASAMVRNLVRRGQKLGTSCDVYEDKGVPALTFVTVKSPDGSVHTLNSRTYTRRNVMFMGLIQEVCTYAIIVRDPQCTGNITVSFKSAMGDDHGTLRLVSESDL